MILSSSKDRKLDVLPPSVTGLSIMGQVRSLSMVHIPEPVLLVGVNRKPTVAYRLKSSN